MRTSAKLATYVVALLLAFGAAAGAGSLIAPESARSEADAAHGHGDEGESAADGHGGHGGDSADASIPGGLQTSEDGYTLRPLHDRPAAGQAAPIAFAIIGPDGERVTDFDEEHGKKLHLIVVRRDLSDYHHLHPEMTDDGVWRTRATFAAGGSYRMFADFVPTAGEPLTLGTDISVPGTFRPQELPASGTTARSGDYVITMHGDLEPGRQTELRFTVRYRGREVRDLQPYLEAYGHLVALRDGDLAYLHVHPEGDVRTGDAGPDISFSASAPSRGVYRLFLEFRHRGSVRTVTFTVPVQTDLRAEANHETEGERDGHRTHNAS